jgi:hypothetical protein
MPLATHDQPSGPATGWDLKLPVMTLESNALSSLSLSLDCFFVCLFLFLMTKKDRDLISPHYFGRVISLHSQGRRVQGQLGKTGVSMEGLGGTEWEQGRMRSE